MLNESLEIRRKTLHFASLICPSDIKVIREGKGRKVTSTIRHTFLSQDHTFRS